jgi:hypothetical protein
VRRDLKLILVYCNRTLEKLRGISGFVWKLSGLLWIAFMLLSIYAHGTGGPAFHWLYVGIVRTFNPDMTTVDSLAVAISYVAALIFEYSVAISLGLWILHIVLRYILLLDAYDAVGVIESLRQSGIRVNWTPLMAMQIRFDTSSGPIVVRVRKLVDLGNMPRRGQSVRLRVSRIDPACVSYRGTA